MIKEFNIEGYTPFQLMTLGKEKFYGIITNEFRKLNNDIDKKVTYAETKFVVFDGSVAIQVKVICYSEKE